MELEQTQTKQISVTPAAANAVEELLTKRDLEGYALRVFISGGGCSGFQYGMALEQNIRESDNVFHQHDIKVVVDEVSIEYLDGATIDYVDEVMGSGFKIDNPNAIASCGCGNSFRTTDDAGSSASGGCSGC